MLFRSISFKITLNSGDDFTREDVLKAIQEDERLKELIHNISTGGPYIPSLIKISIALDHLVEIYSVNGK